MNASAVTAFIAGLLSISSPCVLPLLPVYLAHLAGTSGEDTSTRTRIAVLSNAAAYILGFSVVFVMLGIALGAAGAAFGSTGWLSGNRGWVVRIGGSAMVLMGLYQIGAIRIPYLSREHRMYSVSSQAGRLSSSFLIGVTFGAGWSPCVGPVLGSILTMAAAQQDVTKAGWLLALYSLGLAVPFLGIALAYGSASSVVRSINRHIGGLTNVSGIVMVAVGAIMILGIYQQLFARITGMAPWTPWEPTV
jgi:cytochrome c-type biogenesis protein